jgi:hypothetical protein
LIGGGDDASEAEYEKVIADYTEWHGAQCWGTEADFQACSDVALKTSAGQVGDGLLKCVDSPKSDAKPPGRRACGAIAQ